MPLLNLPPEIITAILSHLSPKDLLSCELAAKYLHTAIQASVGIQYTRALTLAQARDSPFSVHTTSDKLRSLLKIEEAWKEMRADFTLEMEVPLRQSGVYDLSAGVYLLSTADRLGLGYTKLPSREGEDVGWQMIHVGKTIVDIGLCVYEHDLVAIVTSSVHTIPAGEPNTHDFALELMELSTKMPHPLARINPIYIMNSLWERPSIGIEIVGKHLVLILSFNTREHPEDRVFVYEWRTGVTIASFEARCHTYSSVIFLDEDTFLLPNTRSNTLDVFRIPRAPILTRLEPILLLALPPLIQGRILGFMSCRAEPNPVGKGAFASMRARRARAPTQPEGPSSSATSSSPPISSSSAPPFFTWTPTRSIETTPNVAPETPANLFPERDFLLDPDTALCLFELRIHVLMFHLVPGGGLQMGFPFRYSFTFVVPRKALVELVEKHAKAEKEVQEPQPEPKMPSASMSATPDEPRWTVVPPSPSSRQLPSIFDHYSTTSQHDHLARRDLSPPRPPRPTLPEPPPTPPKIPYDAWGPACTRWFGSNQYDVSPRWITTSAGGRLVRMPVPRRRVEEGEEEEGRFYVWDFCEARRREAKAKAMNRGHVGAKVTGKEGGDGGMGKEDAKDAKGKGRADEDEDEDWGGSGWHGGGDDSGNDDEDGAPKQDKGKGKAKVTEEVPRLYFGSMLPLARAEEARMRALDQRQLARAVRERRQVEGQGSSTSNTVAPRIHLNGDGRDFSSANGEEESGREAGREARERDANAQNANAKETKEQASGTDTDVDADADHPQNHEWKVRVEYDDGTMEYHRLPESGVRSEGGGGGEGGSSASAGAGSGPKAGAGAAGSVPGAGTGRASASTSATRRNANGPGAVGQERAAQIEETHGPQDSEEDEEEAMDSYMTYEDVMAAWDHHELLFQDQGDEEEGSLDGDGDEDEDMDAFEEGGETGDGGRVDDSTGAARRGAGEVRRLFPPEGEGPPPEVFQGPFRSNVFDFGFATGRDIDEDNHGDEEHDHEDEDEGFENGAHDIDIEDLPDFADLPEAPEEEGHREPWTVDPIPEEGEGPLILEGEAVLDCPDVFENPVRHSLPCIVRESRTLHRWHGVLLDEERVIGIVADPMMGHVEDIEIHHFG